MYDRNLDFNIPDPAPREYFGIPMQQIYFFYSDIKRNWVYERVDNCVFSLKQFNQDHGQLVLINNSDNHDEDDIMNYLEEKYPHASIEMCMSEHDWILDKQHECRY